MCVRHWVLAVRLLQKTAFSFMQLFINIETVQSVVSDSFYCTVIIRTVIFCANYHSSKYIRKRTVPVHTASTVLLRCNAYLHTTCYCPPSAIRYNHWFWLADYVLRSYSEAGVATHYWETTVQKSCCINFRILYAKLEAVHNHILFFLYRRSYSSWPWTRNQLRTRSTRVSMESIT